ncbi:phosphonopyruvate decarboxylase [Burkholderia ambifaria]|jgi:phosphonopyruvate decarboxylase|uniref:phosphonopyruvate decarboxylase n=1 Tax=Burkholderia ambifaria TaxID=152480 RepID=UPI000D00BF5E|nr:phosphonopyruvate decarboxylase [Burkholderia ambifaria]PRF99431.1 phosphonopyruvate decarboxylase [Burkholderia ambifaria]
MLLDAELILNALKSEGVDFYTGVPCSGLTPLINAAINLGEEHYVAATQEGEAIAIAAGAALAGRGAVVLTQNSGLGNLVNPLTSMNLPSGIPVLMFITWRGQPGTIDEPQHGLMGQITIDLLALMGIEAEILSLDQQVAQAQIARAAAYMRDRRAVRALVVPATAFAGVPLNGQVSRTLFPTRHRDRRRYGSPPSRFDALTAVRKAASADTAIIATTGKTGRELFTLEDRAEHFYLVGAMGSASGVGLGVALNREQPVIVLDGDGAALMRLGTFATIGAYRPVNLLHVVLDNGVHDSTGGQKTVSEAMSFCGVASACGYATSTFVDHLDDLSTTLAELNTQAGPHLVCVSISAGSIVNLGRPHVSPADVALRFGAFLARTPCATEPVGTLTVSQEIS